MYRKFRNAATFSAAATAIAAVTLFPNNFIEASSQYTESVPSTTSVNASLDSYRIVAVGDSITAGYEPGFTEQSTPYGYVEHVYEQALFHGLRAEVENYSILGLKADGLARQLDAAASGESLTADALQKGLPDQRSEEIAEKTAELGGALSAADLVVMTIGGNDLINVIDMLDDGDSGQQEAAVWLATELDVYADRLEESLRTIVKLNPEVKIEVADQYLPIPAPIKLGGSTVELYPEENRQFLLKGIESLDAKLNAVVASLQQEGFDISVAPISPVFSGNEITYTYILGKDIHPNKTGYAAIGKVFAEKIWGDYRTIASAAAAGTNVPSISVIVNGKQLQTPYAPVLQQSRTFVSMRDITDAMGAKLVWDNAGKTATVDLNGHSVQFKIGSASVVVDGVSKTLNAPAPYLQKINSEVKTYLPLAALSEGLGLQTVYRSTLKAVFIND